MKVWGFDAMVSAILDDEPADIKPPSERRIRHVPRRRQKWFGIDKANPEIFWGWLMFALDNVPPIFEEPWHCHGSKTGV